MSEFKQCHNGHYYSGDSCPYCALDNKETEKLKSELESLRKDPPLFPPLENAMCYGMAPTNMMIKRKGVFHNEQAINDGGGENLSFRCPVCGRPLLICICKTSHEQQRENE